MQNFEKNPINFFVYTVKNTINFTIVLCWHLDRVIVKEKINILIFFVILIL